MFRIEDKMKVKLLPASEHRVGGELVTHGCDLWLFIWLFSVSVRFLEVTVSSSLMPSIYYLSFIGVDCSSLPH